MQQSLATTGVTRWRQIELALAADITGGLWQPGDRLPTESQLAERFAVNRHTVRRALQALAEQGLIRIEQGRGTFVQNNVLEYTLGPRTRFSEAVLSQNRTPGSRFVSSDSGPATPEEAEALRLPLAAPVIRLHNLASVDGRPLSLATHTLCRTRFAGIEAFFAETPSMTACFARFGLTDYRRVSTRITARLPTAEEMRTLDIPRTQPLLITHSIDSDPAGIPVQAGHSRFAANRVQLTV